jgi:hypothetical protein
MTTLALLQIGYAAPADWKSGSVLLITATNCLKVGVRWSSLSGVANPVIPTAIRVTP